MKNIKPKTINSYWRKLGPDFVHDFVHDLSGHNTEAFKKIMKKNVVTAKKQTNKQKNSAARLLTGTRYTEHIISMLQQLHWLPVYFQAHFKVFFIIYKALYSLGPGYLKDYISSYEPSWCIR